MLAECGVGVILLATTSIDRAVLGMSKVKTLIWSIVLITLPVYGFALLLREFLGKVVNEDDHLG